MANYMKGRAQPVNWSYSTKQSHLPPKSPFSTMGPSFVDCSPSPFGGHTTFAPTRGACKQHQRTSSESFLIEEQPSWLDDLLNEPDTPVKKGSHRRSASDSVTFLEFPGTFSRIENIAEEEEFDNSGAVSLPLRGGSLDLDKFDQEIRPFSSYEAKSSKKPPIRSREAGATYKCGSESARESWKSGNSGKSSISKDFDNVASPTVVPEETQEGDVHTATGSGSEGRDPSHAKPSEPDIDPKRAKQFAQRSRVRKLQYISELERNVSALQAEESEVSAEVAFLNQQRLILTLENKALKQRIAGLAQEKLIKDAQHELLRKEVQRLRILYQQQQLQQHSSMQTSHSHQIPTSADFDLQQLQFSKLSLGPLKQVESKPALSDAVLGIVKQIGGVAAASGHDDDGTVCWDGRTDVVKNSVPSNCMIAGSSKKLDNRRMMTGGGPLPVDFMLQNS